MTDNVPNQRVGGKGAFTGKTLNHWLHCIGNVMPIFDLPETPDFVTATVAACSNKYHECVEQFLRSIGVTKQNAHEYEIRKHQGDGLNAEIWHNGAKVGEIVTRWETDSGYRFVVECKSA